MPDGSLSRGIPSVLREFDMYVNVSHPRCMAKPALGRGLGALLGGATASGRPAAPTAASIVAPQVIADNGERIQNVALDRIRPSPFQPRKDFSKEALQELADSI